MNKEEWKDIKVYSPKHIIIYENDGNIYIDSHSLESDEATLDLFIKATVLVYKHIIKGNKKDFLKSMEIYYDKEK